MRSLMTVILVMSPICVAFVAVAWFDVWFGKPAGTAANLSTWPFADGLPVAAMLAVGLRLQAAGGRHSQG